MVSLLQGLIDISIHLSKLGRPVPILDLYFRWLNAHHYSLQKYPSHSDLQLLQAADIQQSYYARLPAFPTHRHQLTLTPAERLAHQLEKSAERSIYKLYKNMYHSIP